MIMISTKSGLIGFGAVMFYVFVARSGHTCVIVNEVLPNFMYFSDCNTRRLLQPAIDIFLFFDTNGSYKCYRDRGIAELEMFFTFQYIEVISSSVVLHTHAVKWSMYCWISCTFKTAIQRVCSSQWWSFQLFSWEKCQHLCVAVIAVKTNFIYF